MYTFRVFFSFLLLVPFTVLSDVSGNQRIRISVWIFKDQLANIRYQYLHFLVLFEGNPRLICGGYYLSMLAEQSSTNVELTIFSAGGKQANIFRWISNDQPCNPILEGFRFRASSRANLVKREESETRG